MKMKIHEIIKLNITQYKIYKMLIKSVLIFSKIQKYNNLRKRNKSNTKQYNF